MQLFRHNLPSFIDFAFRATTPATPFRPNWHIDVMADYLSRCHAGEMRRLLINLPPRYLKSFCASVCFPAWLLGLNPHAKILVIAGSEALARQLERRTLQLMTSVRYRALFPQTRLPSPERGVRVSFGGYCEYLNTATSLMGRGGDYIIIDDPINPGDARDPEKLSAINAWYDANVYQRLDSKDRGCVIVVMQRLHENDLAGHVLKYPDWRHLSLPAFATEPAKYKLSTGKLIRRRPQSAIDKAFESRNQLIECLRRVGAANFMAQYQQEPYPATHGGAAVRMVYREFTKPGEKYSFAAAFLEIPEIEFVLHKVFGEPNPAPPVRKLSNEEWRESCRLDEAEKQNPDPYKVAFYAHLNSKFLKTEA